MTFGQVLERTPGNSRSKARISSLGQREAPLATHLENADSKEEALEILKDIGQRAERGDYP